MTTNRRPAPLMRPPILFLIPADSRGYTVTDESSGARAMPLTNAEKQARYRERHLGVDGEKARIQLFLSAAARTLNP
jgi:hypothetical protein